MGKTNYEGGMTTYDNTNRGVLFREQDKENERGPDYTGSLNVGGTEYRVAGWIKEGKSGKFLSLSVQPKERRAQPDRAPTRRDAEADDIPW